MGVRLLLKPIFNNGSYEIDKMVYHMRADKVPAFREEPYMASTKNYISKVTFQLARYYRPGNSIQRYMGTWSELNDNFLERPDFGKVIDGSGFLSERVNLLVAGATSKEEKIQTIISDVKSSVSWNRYNQKYPSASFRDVLKNAEGNAADINLLLINMLRKASLKADPVLISTRSNGFVREQFALSKQFNYVICAVELGDKLLLLDATEATLPTGLLPQRLLNGRGWRVSSSKPGWIDLKSNGKETSLVTANLELTEDGTLKGVANITFGDYAAFDSRRAVIGDNVSFADLLLEDTTGQVVDRAFEGLRELDQNFKLKVNIETNDNVEALGDLVYINPFLLHRIKINPFKLDERAYPVDFVSPIRKSYMLTLKIPEGYQLESLPKNEVVTLPEGGGKFTYYIRQVGQNISFRSAFNLNKTLFSGPEYPILKQLFALMVDKGSEMIVLKKTN